MQIKYIGNRQEIEAYGLLFPNGEPVDVSVLDEWQQIKLSNNQHFQIAAKKRGRKPRQKYIEDVTDEELEVLTTPDGD